MNRLPFGAHAEAFCQKLDRSAASSEVKARIAHNLAIIQSIDDPVCSGVASRALSHWQRTRSLEQTALQIHRDLIETILGSAFGVIGEVQVNMYNGSPFIYTLSQHARRAFEQQSPDLGSSGYSFLDFDMLAAKLMKKGEAVVVTDPATLPVVQGPSSGPFPLRNFIGLPIMFGDELVGVVAGAHYQNPFSDEMKKRTELILRTLALVVHDKRNPAKLFPKSRHHMVNTASHSQPGQQRHVRRRRVRSEGEVHGQPQGRFAQPVRQPGRHMSSPYGQPHPRRIQPKRPASTAGGKRQHQSHQIQLEAFT